MHFNFYAWNSSIRSHIKFSWRCRYSPFDCCYCISLSSIQSLVNPSNFTFCCRVRVHNATDLHFFLFFIEKSSSPLPLSCQLLQSSFFCYSGLEDTRSALGMLFRSSSMDCVRFINPIGMSFNVQWIFYFISDIRATAAEKFQ